VSLVGASFGFLWFNCHPAKVFMGDTGSLDRQHARRRHLHQAGAVARGGWRRLGHRQSRCLSSGLVRDHQARGEGAVYSSRASPLRAEGVEGKTVIVRFWILSIMFAFLGLATLKLR
jgi:phospho-N-acetylmuramoyl-pentapeptide-transferase